MLIKTRFHFLLLLFMVGGVTITPPTLANELLPDSFDYYMVDYGYSDGALHMTIESLDGQLYSQYWYNYGRWWHLNTVRSADIPEEDQVRHRRLTAVANHILFNAAPPAEDYSGEAGYQDFISFLSGLARIDDVHFPLVFG